VVTHGVEDVEGVENVENVDDCCDEETISFNRKTRCFRIHENVREYEDEGDEEEK
jgi:hypothetical protein